jgi:hypothetical protein
MLRQAYISEEAAASTESRLPRSATSDSHTSGLFYGAAMLMSLIGFSVSVFSISQLQSAAPPKTLIALSRKQN